MKFKGEDLRNLVWHNYEGDDLKIIENKIEDASRWSINYGLVFEHNGKFYATGYSVGATEQQDERPFEYQDEVECKEVVPVEKTITVYESVA